MQAQELTLEELKQLYKSRISRDFVPNELRPWGNMRALALRGAYRAFAYREKGAVLAYGIFAHCPGAALLDYLAVDPALRGRGLGTRFFQALQGAARQLGASFFLIEAESLESAQTPAEKEVLHPLRLPGDRAFLLPVWGGISNSAVSSGGGTQPGAGQGRLGEPLPPAAPCFGRRLEEGAAPGVPHL